MSVAEVREHLDVVVLVLHRELLDGSYRPGLIRRVWIPKSGGGERGLGIPNVIDRLVQQAVHQVLSPSYELTFHGSSHGFRPGRSCHTAIAEAKKHLEEGHEWVVDLDLGQFFDSSSPRPLDRQAGAAGQGPTAPLPDPKDAQGQGGHAERSGGEHGGGSAAGWSTLALAQ
ncbi:MAG: reverse transcriptase domain-containing protein [Minicystis sp.]